MVGESLAIILVILAMAVMYLRSGRHGVALLTLPFICIPLCNIAGRLLRSSLSRMVSFSPVAWGVSAAVIGLLLAVLCCSVLARHINRKSYRFSYLAASYIFNAVLAVVYILHWI